MYRSAIEDLFAWKNSEKRKPLIIRGARQVGKTWLMKEFGRQAYSETVYVNFDSNPYMENLFSGEINPKRLVEGIEIYAGKKITPSETLIIFDEVQEVPRALASLKYFTEDAPEYHIVAAGSLLGIASHPGTSFPVGKVSFLNLYPMSYKEFLTATGSERFAKLLDQGDWTLITAMKETFIEALRKYYFVGGMPEAVKVFAEEGDYLRVREVQTAILSAYVEDFSKHAPTSVVPRIRLVWNSIPSQLAKENRKFVYGALKDGGRAKDFETAIMWLSDAGLINKVSRVNAAGLPLKSYEDLKAFKIYLLDVGLLGALSGLQPQTLLSSNKLFTEFKGALTEQYVAQQLQTLKSFSVFYYTNDRSTCEVDFVISDGARVIPVEVKAEVNLKAKSLKIFREKYSPEVAVRTSMADYRREEGLVNLPLYAVSEIGKV